MNSFMMLGETVNWPGQDNRLLPSAALTIEWQLLQFPDGGFVIRELKDSGKGMGQ
jgi:hypothetical protein